MGIFSDIVREDKVEMCPEACCGKPITECKCGPDCEHCDCHSKNAINEGTQGCADCEWIKDETDGDITTCDECAAEKREKTNESEKRWKQTSMSPEEAIAKYGKENVKVKKGALRNGDDMVEVFVESMNEVVPAVLAVGAAAAATGAAAYKAGGALYKGVSKIKKNLSNYGKRTSNPADESMNEGGNSVEAFMSHVVDHAKEIQADNYRMTDSSYYEFTDEIDTDDEEFMSMPQVQAILKAIPHVDMENTDIKHAIDVLASGELLEAETESMNEAGGYYTQPGYDMIEQHGIEKVMHELLTALDADVIQDALSRMNTENESYSPGDEYADSEGMLSNCCGAPMTDYHEGHGRCSDCKDMAAGESEEEYYESKVMQAREQIAQEESPVIEANAELKRIQDLVKFR